MQAIHERNQRLAAAKKKLENYKRQKKLMQSQRSSVMNSPTKVSHFDASSRWRLTAIYSRSKVNWQM
jgi:hypothetical protein